MFALLAVLAPSDPSGGHRYLIRCAPFAIRSPLLDSDTTLLARSSAADHSQVPDTPRRAKHDPLTDQRPANYRRMRSET